MNIRFKAKSSSGEPYAVEVSTGPNGIRVFCHCPAGVVRQLCKHKVALIRGDGAILADPEQASSLAELKQSPEWAFLAKRLNLLEKELEAIEKEKTTLAKRARALKANFGRELAEGIRV